MAYKQLAPCPTCRRHMRVEDRVCPFCATTLPAGFVVVAPPSRRLARSVALAGSLAVAACGTSTGTETGTDTGVADGSVDDTGATGVKYGAPPIDTGFFDSSTTDAATDAATDTKDGSVDDTGAPGTKYGAPPPPDAG